MRIASRACMPRMRTLPKRYWLGLFIILLNGIPAFTQSTAGTINGTITDTTGAPISGAAVEAVEVDRNAHYPTTTDGQGNFSLTNIAVGRYEMRARTNGFLTVHYPVFELTPTQTAETDMVMKVQPSSYTTFPGPPIDVATDDIEMDAIIPFIPLEPLPLPRKKARKSHSY